MSLSNCDKCQYFDRSPHHSGDILCAIDPAYAKTYQRLKSLDDYSKSCLPIDNCSNFELNPVFEQKAIALNLNVSDWQKLIQESSLPHIREKVNEVLVECVLSLTKEDWQEIADSTTIPNVRLTLANAGIEPQRERWIHVDSSCINSIAFNTAESALMVRFNFGQTYQYRNVTESTFHDFIDAESKGQFFNLYIKDCYSYSSVA